MRVVVQRCENAFVTVDDKMIGKISKGLCLLVGFTYEDDEEIIKKMIQKILKLRIFPDDNGVMNKSVMDSNGSILSKSIYTLC